MVYLMVMLNFNLFLFNLINQWARRFSFLDWTAIFFAEYSQYLLAIVILAILLFSGEASERKKSYWMILSAVIAGVISRGVLTELIRFIYFVPRPFVNYPVYQLVGNSASEASFPSGHMTFWWAVSFAIYAYNKKLGVFAMAVSLVMGIARIFVGLHWPYDILGGIIIGSLVGWAAGRYFEKKTKTA